MFALVEEGILETTKPVLAFFEEMLPVRPHIQYPGGLFLAPKHFDLAIKDFREMKMQPSLERALRHKGILKA